jgi:hypothetical protein
VKNAYSGSKSIFTNFDKCRSIGKKIEIMKKRLSNDLKKKYLKKPGVCAENRVRAIVGQPSARRRDDVKPRVSADYPGFFINALLFNSY